MVDDQSDFNSLGDVVAKSISIVYNAVETPELAVR